MSKQFEARIICAVAEAIAFLPIMGFGEREIASVTATLMSGQKFVSSCVGR